MELKTPLYENHVKHNGKIVPFAGFLLPVQYEKGIIAEHMAVRTECGLFDVSHMGEILCSGPDAEKNLDYILPNKIAGMYDGQVKYMPMCNENGGIVDDLLVYKVKDNSYLLVVNASNIAKDYDWFVAHQFGDVVFTNISDQVGQIAIQGPKAIDVMKKLMPEEALPSKYYTARYDGCIDGMKFVISRTGYTGERGYEIYLAAEETPRMWELLLETGKEEGLICCGLGARDTLRLEAGLPLYGHEMTDDITPLETSLDFFVKMEKGDFIGKEALIAKGEPTKKRIGLKVTGRGIVREHSDIFVGDKKIGKTTSGTKLPYLNGAYAMAIIDTEYTEIGTEVEVDVRGRRITAEVMTYNFYKSKR